MSVSSLAGEDRRQVEALFVGLSCEKLFFEHAGSRSRDAWLDQQDLLLSFRVGRDVLWDLSPADPPDSSRPSGR